MIARCGNDVGTELGSEPALNFGQEAERHAPSNTVVRHDEVDYSVGGDVVDQSVLPDIYCQYYPSKSSQVSLELLGGILDRMVILAAGVSVSQSTQLTWLQERIATSVLDENGRSARY